MTPPPNRSIPIAGADRVDVWLFDIDSPAFDSPYRDALRLLNDGERRRAERRRNKEARRHFVLGRAALRTLLGRRLDRPPESIELSCGERGKPTLAGDDLTSDLRFNLSHAGRWVLIAVTTGREVGADVEPYRPIAAIERFARGWLSQTERRQFERLDDVRRLRFVYRLWTANEALLKATGEGLTLAAQAQENSLVAPPSFDGPPIGRAGRTWRIASGDLDLEGCFAVAIESGALETPRVEWRRRSLAEWLAERFA